MADPRRDDDDRHIEWVGKSHEDAQAGNIDEHATSVREALKNHRWAVLWSLTVSMSVIMEGMCLTRFVCYDTILMGNFLGFPAFQKQFGENHGGDAGYQVAAAWHCANGVSKESALWGGSIAGCIIGVFLNGYLISHFGFKRVFLASLLAMTAFIFPSFFGKSAAVQTIGQVLCGQVLLSSHCPVPWGIFATIGPAYASEILPLALRSYLTAYVNMCFAIGQFIGAGVIQGLLKLDDQWSFRIPFAVQWVWPVPLFVACFFMPESPWWLVQKGRLEEAEQVLRRVTSGPQRDKAPQTLAMMVHTNALEREIEAGSSYIDCFRGSHRRRTEIACVSFAGQVLAGSQFAYSGTYFFQQAGMGADDAYKLGLGGTAIAFVGTILSWFLMRRVGRRTIYLCGMSGIVAYLFIIGVLTTGARNNGVVWRAVVAMSSEVSSTRLRSKTICLARNVYYLTLLWANILEPYMVNPTSWNWRGYTGFFWCGWAALTLLWAFFRLTETKDRTFEELDLMFAAGVPTRRFAVHHVDAYAEDLAVKDRVVAGSGDAVAKKTETEA
ncbi:hypothetical protein PG991_000713 [Apiospora marii]|uniref:Major facilitator superfamily (MFS) profile domain-containing protein n=1 Tax=Apiospora marii TaxID=335849 RepID=A0ABR1SSS1_9PEZI